MEEVDKNGNTVGSFNEKLCFICQDKADLCCPNCNIVWFCCDDHGVKHSDGKTCYPFTISYQEGRGRQLKAARDIKAGEVILKENPLVVGPNAEGEPICLSCQAGIDCSYLCQRCGYPMCDVECAENQIHRRECEVLSNGPRPVFEADKVNEEAYHSILPLRLLLLKYQNAPAAKLTEGLMDHVEERRGNEYWNTSQEHVVHHIINKCGQKQFSVDQINRAVGILETNCWEFQSFVTCGNRGLFPLLALVNHSCRPNLRNIWMTESPFTNTSYACIDIKQGEEINNSYLKTTSCGIARRQMILDMWYFECRCERCRDPTELGSHANTILCTNCTSGLLLPKDPLTFQSDWECSQSHNQGKPCGHTIDHQTVATLVQRFLDIATHLSTEKRYSVKDWLGLESTAKCHFHPQHEVMCEIAKWLVPILCRGPESRSIGHFPRYLVETKLRLASNYLNVLNIVDPGMSRNRAKTSYEILECQVYLTRTDFLDNKMDLQTFRQLTSGYVIKIQEVVSILEYLGTSTAFEGMVYNAAKVLGESCKNFLQTTIENQNNES